MHGHFWEGCFTILYAFTQQYWHCFEPQHCYPVPQLNHSLKQLYRETFHSVIVNLPHHCWWLGDEDTVHPLGTIIVCTKYVCQFIHSFIKTFHQRPKMSTYCWRKQKNQMITQSVKFILSGMFVQMFLEIHFLLVE